jgi:DNA-binding CsgD family transcriptional regulator
VSAVRAPGLLGRTSERLAIDRLLADVRGGQSASLVIRGEPGIGKTALLRYAARRASGFRVEHITGVEAEMELPYAGIQQLCAPMLPRLDMLPQPQQDGLRVALGLAPGQVPERFLVGLAVLGLLSAEAEERPLLCLVDDAQWLDAASGLLLGFVARRLSAESVAIVIAVREPSARQDFDGLPDLPLRGLTNEDARTLLKRAVPAPLDDRVRDRLVAETRGNPLALLDLPHSVRAGGLAGGFELLAPTDLPRQLEDHYLERVDTLPQPTQRLLLLAAAEPMGDATLVWRAAERLGIERSALGPAEDARLVEIGVHVRFRHPLVRSAIYRAAAASERRAVHGALAEVTDPDTDPDRCAWHRAHAALTVDEAVAGELERSADRAQARGGVAATAAFLARAAELTPDPAERGRRVLAAAQAAFDAGSSDAAVELLAMAEMAPLDELQHAGLERLRAQIAFNRTRGRNAPALLVDAARRLESLDVEMARETYLEALAASMFAGRLGGRPSIREVAEAALAVASRPQPPRAIDLLLDGLMTRFTAGYAAAVLPLRTALDAFRRVDELSARDVRWLWLACRLAQALWDDELWAVLATSGVRVARETGALSVLPIALTYRAALHVHEGAFARAAALVEEVDAITVATDMAPVKYGALMLAAWTGDEAEGLALIEELTVGVRERGEGMALGINEWATALLYNANGRYADALAAAQRGSRHDDVGLFAWSLVELIEAGARCDATDASSAALDQLSERTRASGTEWALGIEACSRALLSDPRHAEPLYREAIERLERSRGVIHATRARLLYGEWLRSENRRTDAREQLRVAHERFSRMGAKAFAERAGGELSASGGTVRKRPSDAGDDLTPQERQIAQLARDGLSNPDIGARLFLSPRTVQFHLRKVYSKLKIRSRRELSSALPSSDSEDASGLSADPLTP